MNASYNDTKRVPAWSIRVGDLIAVHDDTVPATAGQAPGARYVTVTATLTEAPANLTHLNTEGGGYHVIACDRMVLAQRNN